MAKQNVNSVETYMQAKLLAATVLVAFLAARVSANRAPGDAPYSNTWLVLGTFDNLEGTGMRTDLIGDTVQSQRTPL